jgi:hypothetical protein
VHDLHVGAVGQGRVGDVGLPAFVGLLGGEAQVAALGPFVGLRGDEAAGGQDPPDGADRRRRLVGAQQVAADGVGAGFVAVPVQVLADPDDLVLDLARGLPGTGVRAS